LELPLPTPPPLVDESAASLQ
jgi:hypothetical protein